MVIPGTTKKAIRHCQPRANYTCVGGPISGDTILLTQPHLMSNTDTHSTLTFTLHAQTGYYLCTKSDEYVNWVPVEKIIMTDLPDLETEFRYDTAQVRRYAHHMQNGGTLRQHDIDYCVETCEDKDHDIERLRAEIKRLKKLNLTTNPDSQCGKWQI